MPSREPDPLETRASRGRQPTRIGYSLYFKPDIAIGLRVSGVERVRDDQRAVKPPGFVVLDGHVVAILHGDGRPLRNRRVGGAEFDLVAADVQPRNRAGLGDQAVGTFDGVACKVNAAVLLPLAHPLLGNVQG